MFCWRLGLAATWLMRPMTLTNDVSHWSHQPSYSTLSRVSTEMGDRSRVYHLFIQPSHPGQLSLAIPPWLGKMNTGDGYGHH